MNRLAVSVLSCAALFGTACAGDTVHGLPPPGSCDGGCPDATRDAGAPTDAFREPDTTCASVRLTTTMAPPNVILLVDRSGSMANVFDRGLSRWQVLQDALIANPTGLVARLQHTVRFGIALFDGGATCPELLTVLPPALDDYGLVYSAYRSVSPGGSTPTGAAMNALVFRLTHMAEPAGPNVIILATDGEPNDCTPSTDPARGQMLAVAAATSAHAAGYTVDAIGVATDVALTNLQQVATAGGGTAVSVNDTSSLVTALDSLVSGVVSCTLTLSGMIEPTLACAGDVRLNDVPLVCDDPNGWHAVDMTHIALDGTACEALQHPPAAVTATFPCEVIFDPTRH